MLLAPWAQTREHPRRGLAAFCELGLLEEGWVLEKLLPAAEALLRSGFFPINSPVHLLLFACRAVRVCQSDLIWIKNPLKRFNYPQIQEFSLGAGFHWPGPAEEPELCCDSSHWRY